jgi:hypothetical protein
MDYWKLHNKIDSLNVYTVNYMTRKCRERGCINPVWWGTRIDVQQMTGVNNLLERLYDPKKFEENQEMNAF